jgi:hypothetical protein
MTFENKVVRRLFEPRNCWSHKNRENYIIGQTSSKQDGDKKYLKCWLENLMAKDHLEDNIKMDHREIGYEHINWIELA